MDSVVNKNRNRNVEMLDAEHKCHDLSSHKREYVILILSIRLLDGHQNLWVE